MCLNICRSDEVPAELCNETATQCWNDDNPAQAHSDIKIIGELSARYNRP